MSVNEYGWSLCEGCHNAIGGCSWSNSFRPVKGWTAKRVGDTYSIIDCPKFQPDHIAPTKAYDVDAVKDLINAVIQRTVTDYIMALSGRYTYKRPEFVKRELEEWANTKYARFLCSDLDVPTAFANIREKYIAFCAVANDHWDDEPDKHGDIYFTCPMCGEKAIIKGRRRVRRGRLDRITVKTARCSCGCEFRRSGCI